jgi:hypothetical protein
MRQKYYRLIRVKLESYRLSKKEKNSIVPVWHMKRIMYNYMKIYIYAILKDEECREDIFVFVSSDDNNVPFLFIYSSCCYRDVEMFF